MQGRRKLLGRLLSPLLPFSENRSLGSQRVPEIHPRAAWAESRSARGSLAAEDVRFLLVHHTASLNDYVEEDVPRLLRGFFDYHTSPEKGWADIAYNFLIDRFGRIWEGRTGSLEGPVAGDATGGNQGFSQLVCLIGDFSTESPSLEATSSLVAMLAWLADRYGVSTSAGATVAFTSKGSNRWSHGSEVTTRTIAGHRDMSLTTCPGDILYEYVVGDLSNDVETMRGPVLEKTTSTTQTTTESIPPSSSDSIPRSTPEALPSTTVPKGAPPTSVLAAPGATEPNTPDPILVRSVAGSVVVLLMALVIKRRIDNSKRGGPGGKLRP